MATADLFALVEPTVRRSPGAAAIVTVDNQVLSYGKLAQTIASFASHARNAGIGPADRVAIDIANETVRLCLIFALSRIGAVPVPGATAEEISRAGIELSAVISNRLEYRAFPRTIAFHQSWFTSVGAAAVSQPIRKAVSSLLMASSGSTGDKKFMEFSLEMLRQRLDWDDEVLPHANANCLLTLGIATDFGFRNAMRTLRHGGVLVGPAGNPQATIGRLGKHGIGQLVTTPAILVDLAEEMERRPKPLPEFESIITVGGPIAGAYAANAARLFNSTVTNVYGSTETGLVAVATGEAWFVRPGASGHVLPWLQLEIVDLEDRPLPPQREGQVRIKLNPAFAVGGYINETPAHDGSIRDSWFYPGDLGSLSANGQLTVSGRVDELINTGGNKTSSAAIEERLSSIRGIMNVAAIGVRNHLGFDSIGIAICRKRDVPMAEIRKEIARRLNFPCDTQIVDIRHLPLHPSGKIDRNRLRELF